MFILVSDSEGEVPEKSHIIAVESPERNDEVEVVVLSAEESYGPALPPSLSKYLFGWFRFKYSSYYSIQN